MSFLAHFIAQDSDVPVVKTAWPSVAELQRVHTARNKQGIRSWAEQLQLMRKREAQAASGILVH